DPHRERNLEHDEVPITGAEARQGQNGKEAIHGSCYLCIASSPSLCSPPAVRSGARPALRPHSPCRAGHAGSEGQERLLSPATLLASRGCTPWLVEQACLPGFPSSQAIHRKGACVVQRLMWRSDTSRRQVGEECSSSGHITLRLEIERNKRLAEV